MLVIIYTLCGVLALVTLFEITMRLWREVRKSRCYGGGNQHRFRARHSRLKQAMNSDDARAALLFADSKDKAALAAALPAERLVYKGDVCVWCGRVVNEQAATRGS